jgi:DNA-binding CsgD family transcriptional regulator
VKKRDKQVSIAIERNFFFDFGSLLCLPCYVFWKDTDGVYQGYNDYGAATLGYRSGQEIVGKSDLDIFPKEFALVYQSNDSNVIASKTPVFASEEGELKNHFPVIFHSYKIPLYAEHKKIVGVLGLSFTTPAYKQGNVVVPIDNFSSAELASKLNSHPPQPRPNQAILSDREKACMYHLSQGLTLKEIARQLNLSPRTIETYIERVKEKLNCKNKADLIFAFMKYLNNQ